MPKEKSWGIMWNQDMQYAPDLMCKCRTTSLPIQERFSLIVGFDLNGPLSRRSVPVAGVGIFRCNQCHELFWFHLSDDTVDFMKEYIENWNPGN